VPLKPIRGFTIVELMVTVTVVAILAAIAVPTLRSVVENSRIRASSQSLQSGLALARSEAVRLNTQVQFVLTSAGWNIERADNAALLQQGSGREAPEGVTVRRSPDRASRITFNSFGRVTPNPDGTATLASLDIEATNPSGSSTYHPLRVELGTGGVARLCDPSVDTNEPKGCRT
jgi:type IV fimbrial biogenesis protein FimT